VDVTDLVVKPAFDPLEGFLYDEEKVPAYELPDLLAGTRTVKDWEKKRRPELVKLFEDEMFGSVPGKPEALHFRVRDNDPSALGGLATRRQVRIFFNAEESEYEDLLLYIPNRRKGPVPAFMGVNFFGNHTIGTDPGIFLPDSLRYRKDFTVNPRGSQQQRWPLREILERGYAVATYCCEDVVPDADGYPGIRSCYDGYTWGALAAWGWGLSRALDYLETDADVDAARVAVFGHSRMGKAAVWAGARDTRFAMVVSNASGCGGAALSRRRFGETVRRINTHFPYWFCENFHKYGDNESMLPFDQHELLADFIKDLLNKHAVEIVEQVIPQKGTTLEVKNRVLIGVVKPDNPQYANFLNGTATSYYSGDTFPTTIPLDGIDYFAPYISEKGVCDLYEVTKIHTATRVKGGSDDKLRITFDVKFQKRLFADYRIVPLPILHNYNDTTISQLSTL